MMSCMFLYSISLDEQKKLKMRYFIMILRIDQQWNERAIIQSNPHMEAMFHR
jgi:hypothetical protein